MTQPVVSSDSAMPKAIPRTRLELVALRPGEWISVTPARVLIRDDRGLVRERRGPNDYRTTNQLLNRLLRTHVRGVPFLELAAYCGVAMWQFLPSYIWPQVFRAVELAEIVSDLLEEGGPDTFEAVPATDSTNAIWAGIIRAAGIDLVDTGIQPPREMAKGRLRSPRTLAGAVRRRLRRTRPVRWPDTPGGGVLLATLGARHWVQRPGGNDRYDEQFSPILRALHDTGWEAIRLIDCEELPAASFRDRRLDGLAEWYLPGVSQEKIDPDVRGDFAAAWESLRTDPSFSEALSHRGISLLPALEPTLRHAFRETLPECAGYLAGAAKVLDAVRPEALMVTYETGPRQRALVIEAARRSIPTVGLMHGTIYDTHYDYMHDPVTPDPVGEPFGFAVPRVTCVWGDFWRDVLVESGSYPADAVAVTGNPRVEEVLALARRSERTELRAKLGLRSVDRVVLLLTANQSVADFLDAALAVLDEHSDCSPLVKPHPADDLAVIGSKLSEHGYGEKVLHKENLAEAILAADLVVSQLSTAALEAILLRRPLVLVNLDRTPGFAEPVAQTGLARYAETPEELAREVAAALAEDHFEQRSEMAHGEYVRHWFAGGADKPPAERIARIVTQLARGQES